MDAYKNSKSQEELLALLNYSFAKSVSLRVEHRPAILYYQGMLRKLCHCGEFDNIFYKISTV